MDNITEHRRLRLKELLQAIYGGGHGSQTLAAERINCEKAYLSRILSDSSSGKRNIGEKFRVKIEEAFGLPHGWIDAPLGTPVTHSAVHFEIDKVTTCNVVSEEQAQYKVTAPAWPFQKLTKEDWAALSSYQQTALENGLIEFVRAMVSCNKECTT